MFFIPVEFFASLVLAFTTVQVLFRKKKYSVGQLTPMIFVPLAPVLVLLTSFFPKAEWIKGLGPGGHPWYVVAGVAVLSAYIFTVNIRIVLNRFSKDEKH